MTPEQQNAIHQSLAASLFNQSWDLLLKEGRTSSDEELLLDTAHASLYHWRQIGQPVNILRGQWMLSHVYTMLKHKEEAKYHATITLNLAIEQKIQDWDLAYAYSAMARALALNGDKVGFTKYYKLAEEGDRKQFEDDFHDGNWFGML